MREVRAMHVAVLLPDNRVLLAGGGTRIFPISSPYAQNTVEHFNQTYDEHLSRGDWLIPAGRDYRAAFHAELGGPVSVTISDTLAAFNDGGYMHLDMAENSYYAAPQRAADTAETNQALMGVLNTRWDLAGGAMLSGNEWMVKAMDIEFSHPDAPLDEEISQLEEAARWYTLATDRYVELFNTEYFTQFVTLQVSRTHFINNVPTPYLDMQRFAQASAKKSRAYLEIAERQFRKFTSASKEAAETPLR